MPSDERPQRELLNDILQDTIPLQILLDTLFKMDQDSLLQFSQLLCRISLLNCCIGNHNGLRLVFATEQYFPAS